MDRHPGARERLDQAEAQRVQGEPVKAVALAEEAVVLTLAVAHIADDRTGKVLQMPPNLVRAAGLGRGLDERVAAVAGEGRDDGGGGLRGVVVFSRQRVVDADLVGWGPADERPIALLHLTAGERVAQRPRR